ncbi:MAG: UbiX family flavin prenyltransferase [Halioglobus sp.]
MTQKQIPKRIIVGISGASGIVYGVRLLELLQNTEVETHLIVTKAARLTLEYETDYKLADVKALADHSYGVDDIGAALASGSFKTAGMIVAPCSARTLSDISSSATSNLLTRAADVILKERRRLVLMVRETPLHLGHLRSMVQVTEMGAVIAPPVPAFYAQPESLDAMINHTVGRAMDLFDIELGTVHRWKEDSGLSGK